jgi:hypothetical protein
LSGDARKENRQYDCARSPAFTKIVKTPGKFERLSEFELNQARPLLVALAESASDLLCRADSSASESPSRSRHLVGDDQDHACRESPESAHPKASLPSDLCVKNQTLLGQMKYEACKMQARIFILSDGLLFFIEDLFSRPSGFGKLGKMIQLSSAK